MKSQIQQNRKNNYLRLNKNAIVSLGITLLVFNMTTAAVIEITDKINTAAVTKEISEQGDSFLTENNPVEKRNFAPIEDKTILDPETVINNSARPIEEVIAANNQITESNIIDEGIRYFSEKTIEVIIQQDNQIIESHELEVRPLYLERTIEDQIAEDNAIIESDIVNVMQPLDFDTISKKKSR